MKVFISSTVYDLIDVRAEIKTLLQEMGATPVMSDDNLSDFKILPNANSIETCLVNIDSADQYIIILDKRYGPTLKPLGFGDFSATHLEYKRAVEKNMPIHFFARDRLVGDFAVWKRNNSETPPKLSWIQDPKDHAIFTLLKEHEKLDKDVSRSNWYTTFSSSVELKNIVRKRLNSAMLGERLVNEINANRFPLLSVDQECNFEQLQGRDVLRVRLIMTNIGGAPAFNFNSCLEGDGSRNTFNQTVLAPGQSLPIQAFVGIGGGRWGARAQLICSFQSALGISVTERYSVSGTIQGHNLIVSSCSRTEQEFTRSEPIEIKIKEVP